MNNHNFTEDKTVRNYIRDLLFQNKWIFVPSNQLVRKNSDPIVENKLKKALIKINPEIKQVPSRADEVIRRLREIIVNAKHRGIVRANEEFFEWLRGEKTMPFGENDEHVPVRLIDFEDISNNEFIVTMEYIMNSKDSDKGTREDLVLLINGLPVSIGECKSPVNSSVSWITGAKQILDEYETRSPELFVSNVFNFATEGKEFKYGTIKCPLDKWASWRDFEGKYKSLDNIQYPIHEMFNHEVFLDLLKNFIIFTSDNDNRRIKVICRSQQYDATNKIVERVKGGKIKKGLIWHFQGSGKSLLMLFAAMKLRMHKDLKNPTVLVVVDRKDLDSQITGTFTAADIPNMKAAKSIKSLEQELKNDSRKIIITTIFRFKDVKETLNERENIIVLVDEAHRTQEGNLGILMRKALPNASFFGLTGTPINKRERNTFATFGCEEDKEGYISKYSFEDSIRDDATKPLTFEPRLVNLHLDKEKMKKEFDELTDSLSDLEKKELTKRAGSIATFIKSDERIKTVCEDIASHYKNVVEPQGFKAMVVCYDRDCCIKYKEHLDRLLGEEASTIVMTVEKSDDKEYLQYDRKEDEEKRLIDDHYKKVNDPLKILIVTAKLLTGFDAPIAQTMYLDKPLKEHTLLQAICRVNRVYKHKEFGLIVDYIGVFDEVSKALNFDSESMQKVIENIDEYVKEFPVILKKCLSYFEGIDRTVEGYEGLIAAQNCLYNDEIRDAFGRNYSYLSKLWEAISPNPILEDCIEDYRWLTDIYRSIRPSSNVGSLIWHRLGAKTMEIINRNIHAVNIYDDLDKIVLDPALISEIMAINNPVEVKKIELDITKRIRRNIEDGQLQFKELADKLEELKIKYESNFMYSVEFLKELIELAKEVIKREKQSVKDEEDIYAVKTGKAALTELFKEVKGERPNIIVENIVNDIDSKIVNEVQLFTGWQESSKGIRDVKIAILKVFSKYKLQGDKELIEKTYGYIAEYY